MSATEAATRVPDLVGRLADPAAERVAAGALLDAAWATSPRLEVVEPGSLCVDLGGLAPLFGDEPRIGERLIAASAAVGLPVRIGIGATRTLARLAARVGAPLLVVPAGRRAGVPRPAPPRPPRARPGPRAGARALGDRNARRARGAADGRAPRAPRPRGGPAPGPGARRGRRAVRARTSSLSPAARRSRSTGRCRRSPRSPSSSTGSSRSSPPASPSARRARPRCTCRFVSPTAACTSAASAWPRRSATGGRWAASSGPSSRRSGSRRRSSPSPWRPSPCRWSRSRRICSRRRGRARASSARSSAGSLPWSARTRSARRSSPTPIAPTRSAWRRFPERSRPPARLGRAALGHGAALVRRRLVPPRPARVECRAGRPGRVEAEGFRGAVVAAAGPWQTSGEWWTETAWAREEWDVALPDGIACRLARDCATGAWTVDAVYD